MRVLIVILTMAFALWSQTPQYILGAGNGAYIWAEVDGVTVKLVPNPTPEPGDLNGSPTYRGELRLTVPDVAALEDKIAQLEAKVAALEAGQIPAPPTATPIALEGAGTVLRLGANCTSATPCAVSRWGNTMAMMHGCEFRLPDAQTAQGAVMLTVDADGYRIHDMTQALPLSARRIVDGQIETGSSGCWLQGGYVGPPLPDLNTAGELPLYYSEVRNGRFQTERWWMAGPSYWLRVSAF